MLLMQMSFSAAVLIAVIAAIRLLAVHRLAKKAFKVLWVVALARLLLPVKISSPFSVYTLLNRMFSPGMDAGAGFAMAPAHTGVYPTPPALLEGGGRIFPAALAVWMVGFAVCTAFFGIAYWRGHKHFAVSRPVENAFTAEWRGAHPMRRTVKICQSAQAATPLTYGLFQPVVLLPDTIDWQNCRELEYVFAHEYVHIQKLDILYKLLLIAALCIHWFNPMAWMMYLLANRDIELACDEAVVRMFGGDSRASYALTLIQMEEIQSKTFPLCNRFCKNVIEERITAIMKIRKLSIASIAAALFVITSVTTVFATSAEVADKSVIKRTGTAEESRLIIAPKPSDAPEKEPLQLIVPLNLTGYAITCGFEQYPGHSHIDYAAKEIENRPVLAAADGVVLHAGWSDESPANTSVGIYITIDHGDQNVTQYFHLASVGVKAGDTVKQGDTIGLVGNTGYSTGPHLAFELSKNGKPRDPTPYLPI